MDASKLMSIAASLKGLAAELESAMGDKEKPKMDIEMNYDSDEMPEGDSSDKKKMFIAMMKKKSLE